MPHAHTHRRTRNLHVLSRVLLRESTRTRHAPYHAHVHVHAHAHAHTSSYNHSCGRVTVLQPAPVPQAHQPSRHGRRPRQLLFSARRRHDRCSQRHGHAGAH
eukprot:6150389-Prymnesium_polylepis.1